MTMAALGLVFCPVFAPIAWMMAKRDLREMEAGTMDPAGAVQTNRARLLGIAGMISFGLTLVVLTALGIVGWYLFEHNIEYFDRWLDPGGAR
jgi:hypothetical protein